MDGGGRGRSLILLAEFLADCEWMGWVQGRSPSFLNSHNPLVPHALLRSLEEVGGWVEGVSFCM